MDGHAFIRTYEAGTWYLSCVQCPHRIVEGRVETPAGEVVELPLIPNPPTEQEIAA